MSFVKAHKGFTLIELLVSVVILGVVYTIVSLQISNKPIYDAKDNQRKKDIDVLADAYAARALDKNTYQPLTTADFSSGKIPTPPEGGNYQGLLTEDSNSFYICAQLEKGKDINCLEHSDNVNCYCRKSYGATPNPSILPTSSPIGVGGTPPQSISTSTPTPVPTSTPTTSPVPTPTVAPTPVPGGSACIPQTKPDSVTLEGIDGTWCKDSDGNGNYSTAGYCVDKCSSTADYCEANGTNRDGYCSGTWIGVWFNVHCEFGGYVCPSFGKTCSNNACVTPQPIGTNVLDTFNRSNNSYLGIADSGHAWIPIKGQWGISNNTAYPISISGFGFWPTVTYAVVDTGSPDGTLEVTLSKNIQDARIPFRLIDENNNYFVERDGWGYHIEKTVNGQRIELTPRGHNATFVDGDKVKIQLAGSSIKVSINNVLLLSISDDTFKGTKHGIGTYFDKNMRFDDFSFNPSSVSTPSPTPVTTTGTKRVFITSSAYSANLGGLSGADQKCQASAAAVSLGGSWKAWLSTKTVSAASRLTHSGGPYQLLSGTTIANNWADLTDGSILHQIDLDENKATVVRDPLNDTTHPWTGTGGDGSIYNDIHGPYDLCNDWTSNYYAVATGQGYSGVTGATTAVDSFGNSNLINGRWTTWGTGFRCGDQSERLFCFEQ